jgi:DNA-binding MarR family transcriptional regulator
MDRRSETAKLMGEINMMIRQNMRKKIVHPEYTLTQAMVLDHLYNDREMRIGALGRKLGLSDSTVSGVVDRLEKMNSVSRVRSSDDRRIVLVKITDEFLARHKRFEASFIKEFAGMLGNADADELEKIHNGLDSLKKVLYSTKYRGENI